MVFCGECGADTQGGKFCPACGQNVEGAAPAASGVDNTIKDFNHGFGDKTYSTDSSKQGAEQVTGAVRSALNNASDKEKEKQYGQQKWGLFETNYQRNKGITTEQSLQEIENACKFGVKGTGSDMANAGAGASGGAGNFGSGGGGAGGFSSHTAGAGGSSSGSFGSSSGGGFTTSTQKAEIQKGTFGEKGQGGSAYLANYKQRQAAKFKPEGSLR